MTDEPAPEEPQDTMPDDGISPLRGFLAEMHEVYEELVYVGFPDHVSTQIIANVISDSIIGRGPSYTVTFEDDDMDDEDPENDEGTTDGDDGRVE